MEDDTIAELREFISGLSLSSLVRRSGSREAHSFWEKYECAVQKHRGWFYVKPGGSVIPRARQACFADSPKRQCVRNGYRTRITLGLRQGCEPTPLATATAATGKRRALTARSLLLFNIDTQQLYAFDTVCLDTLVGPECISVDMFFDTHDELAAFYARNANSLALHTFTCTVRVDADGTVHPWPRASGAKQRRYEAPLCMLAAESMQRLCEVDVEEQRRVDAQDVCALCMERQSSARRNFQQLDCGHAFHAHCLQPLRIVPYTTTLVSMDFYDEHEPYAFYVQCPLCRDTSTLYATPASEFEKLDSG